MTSKNQVDILLFNKTVGSQVLKDSCGKFSRQTNVLKITSYQIFDAINLNRIVNVNFYNLICFGLILWKTLRTDQ